MLYVITPTRATVRALFFHSDPSRISGFVITIIVNAVKS